jgi:hypothetical protein
MTTARARLVKKIASALGSRQLFWYGTRGDDARSLTDISQFSGSFTILNKYSRHNLSHSVSYEELCGYRVDLDDWDIDNHLFDEATDIFRRSMLTATMLENAIVPYRPSFFLSALMFARKDKALNLGIHAPQQKVFEYKPLLEVAVASMGIPTLEWQYIADQDQMDAEKLLENGPIVVRPSKGSGGSGMAKVETAGQLAALWPKQEEFFASISHFYSNCLPLNVGAVVWNNGDVTVHFPSVQLIGIQSCTSRQFGYCGNDFALINSMDKAAIDNIQKSTEAIGQYLHSQGYRGAFGIDFLLDGNTLRFTEVNPRFQGSTRASSLISAMRDEPCLLLDHVAAMLGLEPEIKLNLSDVVFDLPPVSHIVLHNALNVPTEIDTVSLLEDVGQSLDNYMVDVIAEPNIPCNPDAIIASITTYRSVTDSGYALHKDLETVFSSEKYSIPQSGRKD